MADVQPALLALPPPRVVAGTGLRASLRAAAAMPADAAQAAKRSGDSAFGTAVRPVAQERAEDPQPGFTLRPPLRLNAAEDWVETRFFGDQSGPFVAQQLGQTVQLVSPTLEPSAEIAAYAAAQARVDSARDRDSLLDLQA